MRHRLRQALKAFIAIFLANAAAGLVLGLVAIDAPPSRRFVGSPPAKHAAPRNNLDLKQKGAWWGKWGKAYRPSGYWDITPALLVSPIVHHFGGWDVLAPDICVEGVIGGRIFLADDDGDVVFPLVLTDGDHPYAWRSNHPEDPTENKMHLVVEIDEPIRGFFPVISDLATGDTVRVCGRWVYDRGHDHNEVHPARWVEILREAGAKR